MHAFKLLPLLFLAFFTTGCDNVDPLMATSAAIDAARAITLSDREVQQIAVATSAQVDRQHRIAPPEHPHARRLQRVHRLVMAYAIGGQKSCYECWLTEAERRQLRLALLVELDTACDRVHFFQLDQRLPPWFFGAANRQCVQPFLIV